MTEEYDYLVKLLIVGESGVGKTCILEKYTTGEFSVNHLPTVAIDFRMKVLAIEDKRIKMQIWDTAGQERFARLTASFFKCLLKSSSRCFSSLFSYR